MSRGVAQSERVFQSHSYRVVVIIFMVPILMIVVALAEYANPFAWASAIGVLIGLGAATAYMWNRPAVTTDASGVTVRSVITRRVRWEDAERWFLGYQTIGLFPRTVLCVQERSGVRRAFGNDGISVRRNSEAEQQLKALAEHLSERSHRAS
jgi:hypothetical protein